MTVRLPPTNRKQGVKLGGVPFARSHRCSFSNERDGQRTKMSSSLDWIVREEAIFRRGSPGFESNSGQHWDRVLASYCHNGCARSFQGVPRGINLSCQWIALAPHSMRSDTTSMHVLSNWQPLPQCAGKKAIGQIELAIEAKDGAPPFSQAWDFSYPIAAPPALAVLGSIRPSSPYPLAPGSPGFSLLSGHTH